MARITSFTRIRQEGTNFPPGCGGSEVIQVDWTSRRDLIVRGEKQGSRLSKIRREDLLSRKTTAAYRVALLFFYSMQHAKYRFQILILMN